MGPVWLWLRAVVLRRTAGLRGRRATAADGRRRRSPVAVVAWGGSAVALVLVSAALAGRLVPTSGTAPAPAPAPRALVPADQLAAIKAATGSCPVLSAPRLAAQVMAASGFQPMAKAAGGRQGVAGLTDAVWRSWAPAPRADRSNPADNIAALAHDMCDLVGQLRHASVPGDPWSLALAAYRDGVPAVVSAHGVPDDAADYVDTVSQYAAWYGTQPQFGGAASLAPEPSLSTPSPVDSSSPSPAKSPKATPASPKAALQPAAPQSASPSPHGSTVIINATAVLAAGQSVNNGWTWLFMQGDGNLVARDKNGKTLWASNTQGRGYETVFQGDGNLAVYDQNMNPLWTSGTAGHVGATFVLEPDGNLCVVYQGIVIWAANTAH